MSRMFIINAIITLPLGILGFWVWPGTPSNSKSVFLSKQEFKSSKRTTRKSRPHHRPQTLHSRPRKKGLSRLETLDPRHLGHFLLERLLECLYSTISLLAEKSTQISKDEVEWVECYSTWFGYLLRLVYLLWSRSCVWKSWSYHHCSFLEFDRCGYPVGLGCTQGC